MFTSGDLLSFLGAVLGSAMTIWGAVWIVTYQSRKKTARDRGVLLSFLAILETRLQFTKNEETLAAYLKERDVPGFINRCALILEMDDLLNTPAVADAAEGYRQLYSLHRLRRALRTWRHVFEPYADIPYTDFHRLAAPPDFLEAVNKITVPATIIRASIHLYVADITGRNIFLEEVTAMAGGIPQKWDPDNPYRPEA